MAYLIMIWAVIYMAKHDCVFNHDMGGNIYG